ncbi:MAG: glycosyltransferase family 39 protein [Deltaproteobacteria bacterium]|nr:glycosyltransferase family 39 protein [Deltaproteobacteria bacterium]
MSDPAPGLAAGTRRLLTPALLVALVAGVLVPTLRAPLFMDDYAHLWAIESPALGLTRLGANTYGVTTLDDPEVRSLLPWWTSADFRFDYYRPMSTLLLALEWRLWGRSSAGYHLTSLVAHLVAVLLLYRLIGSLGIGAGGALAGSALLALHPGNLIAVYWISNRSDVVVLALAITALLAYRAAGRAARRGWALHVAAVAALGVAILTKEIACLLPAVFLLHDLLEPGARPQAPAPTLASVLRRGLRATPYLALSASYVLWYRASGHGIRSGYAPSSLELPPLAELSFLARSAVLATLELVTGLPPSMRRHEHLFDGANAALAAGFVAAAAIATALALRGERRRATRLFALGWIGLFTAPTLGFLPSPRYLYVASAGWALLVASVVDGWLASIPSRPLRALGIAATAAYVAVVPALADRWLMGRLEIELGRAFPGLVESYTRGFGPPRDGERIVLVNTPSPATASLIGAAFRFLNPGIDVRAAVLTSFPTPPALVADDSHTLRVSAPPGHHFFEQPVDWIYLTSRRATLGQTFRGADLVATITAMDGDQPTEVTFRFERPLADPAWVPICFDGPERTLRRCPFPVPPTLP